MKLPDKPFLTRKEIAVMLAVSARQVAANEVEWGIHIARRDLNARVIRYQTDLAIAVLRGRGFLA